jgi:hypothetical protein
MGTKLKPTVSGKYVYIVNPLTEGKASHRPAM